MTAPKTSGESLTVSKTAIGSGELRVLLYPGANPKVDLRWFEPGGGPAAVPMPTKDGIAIPLEDIGDIIEGLKQAELRFRRDRIGGAI
jgi:hypothetical protein